MTGGFSLYDVLMAKLPDDIIVFFFTSWGLARGTSPAHSEACFLFLISNRVRSSGAHHAKFDVGLYARMPFKREVETRGRSKRRWSDCNRQDLESIGAVATDAADRSEWRNLVCIGDLEPVTPNQRPRTGESKPAEKGWGVQTHNSVVYHTRAN